MVAMLKPVSPSSSQVMIVGVDDERCKVLTQPEGAISRTGRVGQTSSCALTGELLASDTTQARAVAIFAADVMRHPRSHGRVRRSAAVSAPAQRARSDCRYRHLQSRIAGTPQDCSGGYRASHSR